MSKIFSPIQNPEQTNKHKFKVQVVLESFSTIIYAWFFFTKFHLRFRCTVAVDTLRFEVRGLLCY